LGSIVPAYPEPLVGLEAPDIMGLRPIGHRRPFITAGLSTFAAKPQYENAEIMAPRAYFAGNSRDIYRMP
jgi:hypothetical protein